MDKIVRAYSRLKALRDRITQEEKNANRPRMNLEEWYVRDYHDALHHLEGCGYDIAEFRIPRDSVKPKLGGFNTGTGEKSYSDKPFVDRNLFTARLDAVLNYFVLTSPTEKSPIGFQGPEQS